VEAPGRRRPGGSTTGAGPACATSFSSGPTLRRPIRTDKAGKSPAWRPARSRDARILR